MKGKFSVTIIIIVIMSSLFWSGCATIMKGYDDELQLINPADSLRVFTKDGVELPILKSVTRVKNDANGKYNDETIYSIKLRSNQSYILTLKSGDKEKNIEAHPHISTGWFVLDLVTLSMWVDIYTGSWNFFQPINASF